MAGKPTDRALQDEVAAAVAAAPDGTRRGTIVQQFLNRGVSKASLYVWIERAMTGAAMNKIKGTHSPPIETDVRVIRGLSGAPANPEKPIEFQKILNSLIGDLQMLRAMAKGEDGTVKNARLLLEAAEKIGRTLDRAARIGVVIQDVQAQGKYLNGLSDVIHEEDAVVRDRIFGKMRTRGLL